MHLVQKMERIWVNRRLCSIKVLDLVAARSLVTRLLLHQALVLNIRSNLRNGEEFVAFSEVMQLRYVVVLYK